MRSGDIPKCPVWFAERLALTMAKYPHATMNELTGVAYWEELYQFDERVLAQAFSRAAAESPQFAPSALLVAEHARAVRGPKIFRAPERPMLPEYDESRDPTGRFADIWARVHKGEITRAQAAQEVVDRLAAGGPDGCNLTSER